MDDLAAINRDFAARVRYSRTPEGQAEREKFRRFCQLGLELMRSGEPAAIVKRSEP